MPLLVVRTTVSLSDEQVSVIALELTEKLSQLTGKPPSVFMIDVQPTTKATFALSTEPSAHVAVNIIGDPKQDGNDAITAVVAGVLAPHGISASRTFVTFQVFETTHWGFQGTSVASLH